MDFYGTAAQVIPVLYLALLFESRFLSRQPDSYFGADDDPSTWNPSQAVSRIALTVLMGVGEFAALVGVWQRLALPVIDALVALALLSGLLGVLLPPLIAQVGFLRKYRKASGERWMVVLVTIGLVGFFLAALQVLILLAP